MNTPCLADYKNCVGCMACRDTCKFEAISQIVGKDGHFYIEVDSLKCVGCKQCERVCQIIQSRDYADNAKSSIPYSVYNPHVQDNPKSTSGAMFPALARFFLDNDGVVYGASYKSDNIHVECRRIDDARDLPLLQGSKYQQSDMCGVYHAIADDLRQGRKVLFSGLGCQTAAVLAYFDKNENKENLYTVDIVCGGVSSSLLTDTFVKEFGVKTILGYREKAKYQFSYINEDGKVIKPERSLPLNGFDSMLTNRYSCYDCKFAGLHRHSDFTIGDYWGDKHNDGKVRSLCICHSERAKKLFDKLDIEAENLSWNFVLNNPRVADGYCPFGNRYERTHIDGIFAHCSYKTLMKIYASDIKITDFLWILYKLYRVKCYRKYRKESINRIKKIIET